MRGRKQGANGRHLALMRAAANEGGDVLARIVPGHEQLLGRALRIVAEQVRRGRMPTTADALTMLRAAELIDPTEPAWGRP